MKRKQPASVNEKVGSLKGVPNSARVKVVGCSGARALAVKTAIESRNKIMKAATRIAHPNPTLLRRRDIMIGKMTPPTLDPDIVIPMASPCLFVNKTPTALKARPYY